MNINPPRIDLNATVDGVNGQFSEPWKSFLANLMIFIQAYIGSNGLKPPSFTTAQRDALTGVQEGTLIFNSTTGQIQAYLLGVWKTGTFT